MHRDASRHHVMVVEDDPVSRALLVGYLDREGYRISESDHADDLVGRVGRDGIDLVLLDINLPGKDGLTLTRELRAASRVGIILVTARDDDIDRIVGLELGADDYVTKPFNPRELVVRVKNLLWRIGESRQNGQDCAEHACWRFEGWMLNAHKRQLRSPDGEYERLPQGEFKLLQTLVTHPGQVLSRDQLMDAIHDREWTPNDRSIDVLIGRLRRKLGDSPAAPHFILTAHGAGYIFAGELD